MEGIIRFDLHFFPAPPLEPSELRTVNAWRRILFLLKLVGCDPARYGGRGFGNISQRLAKTGAGSERRAFVISGTQTGGLPDLTPEHYAVVLNCRPEEGRVVARGPARPSSETLTHGVLYALDDSLRFVMHVHSPELWRQASNLGIPVTADVFQDPPAMAAEIRRLMADPATSGKGLFAMGGHEDGLIAFGRTAMETGAVLLRHLARALGSEE